jgi:4-amino-4-deoxy-L-arabinose transferase-like glycosyltransferase
LWENIQYLLHFSNINSNVTFQNFISLQKGTVTQRGVTLFTLIKIIVLQGQIPLPRFILDHTLSLYLGLVVIIFIPIMLFVLFVEKELWKNVALLTFSMLLLPNISADYKLLHVMLPLYLFINSSENSKLDYYYVLCFAALIIPKNYIYLSRIVTDAQTKLGNSHDITMAVPINICLMLVTCLVIMITDFKKWGKKKIKPEIQV